jgi:hypothetical protein
MSDISVVAHFIVETLICIFPQVAQEVRADEEKVRKDNGEEPFKEPVRKPRPFHFEEFQAYITELLNSQLAGTRGQDPKLWYDLSKTTPKATAIMGIRRLRDVSLIFIFFN